MRQSKLNTMVKKKKNEKDTKCLKINLNYDNFIHDI